MNLLSLRKPLVIAIAPVVILLISLSSVVDRCVSTNEMIFSSYEKLVDKSYSYQSYVSDFGTYSTMQRAGRSFFRGKNREHSFPLITGDGFRMIADLIVDDPSDDSSESNSLFQWSTMAACEVAGRNMNLTDNQSIILFLPSSLVEIFFSSGCFERIPSPVVLITHNGDNDMPSGNARYLEHPNLVHWFAQNCDRIHAKLTCIPIGIENRQYGPPSEIGSHGSMPELLLGMMSARLPSYAVADLSLAAYNNSLIQHTWAFFEATHSSRREFKLLLENASPHWIRTSGPSTGNKYFVSEYYRNLIQHVAIVCPRGNGQDSHRAWESLYLGRVIITLRSPNDELWYGLPVVLLNSWEDLFGAEKEILETAKTYATFEKSLNIHKLFIPYWICRIGSAAYRGANFCGREAILSLLRT